MDWDEIMEANSALDIINEQNKKRFKRKGGK